MPVAAAGVSAIGPSLVDRTCEYAPAKSKRPACTRCRTGGWREDPANAPPVRAAEPGAGAKTRLTPRLYALPT
ncbi:MAG: hypothetical protein ACK55S_02795, partial [Planctomycetota bacterium]